MSRFFKPYEGGKPFLFISYPHKNSAEVLDTIRILHDKGIRLWYDEGIPAGSDWPANIARHLGDCEAVLFFLAERALASPNCFSEIRTAARLHKPILVIRLDGSEPEGEWRELLRDYDEIPLLPDAVQRAEAILTGGFVGRRFHRRPGEKLPRQAIGLAASILLFLASGAAVGALATGQWSPIPAQEITVESSAPEQPATPVPTVSIGEAERFFAVSFPSTQMERAVRSALSIPEGEIQRWNLAEIKELYFCGNMSLKSVEGVAFSSDGSCRVNGAPVVQGQISDLSLLSDMVSLERLALICQPLGDLSRLNGHTLLRELSLAGSTVEDLSALRELPSLETLHLEHTAVRDLRPLESLPGLKTVTVSRDMLPLRWSEGKGFAVILLNE